MGERGAHCCKVQIKPTTITWHRPVRRTYTTAARGMSGGGLCSRCRRQSYIFPIPFPTCANDYNNANRHCRVLCLSPSSGLSLPHNASHRQVLCVLSATDSCRLFCAKCAEILYKGSYGKVRATCVNEFKSERHASPRHHWDAP